MATRTSRNSTRSTSSRTSHDVDPLQQQRAAGQRSQQQMAVAAEAATAMLRSAEVWTQLQLHALQRSGETWRIAAEQLRAARGPMELIAAQNQLAMNTFVQTLQLGQEFLQATLAAQPDVARAPQEQSVSASESMAPMMQVWQSMMSPMGLNGATAAAH